MTITEFIEAVAHNKIIQLVVLAIVCDTVFGVLRAIKEKKFNSCAGIDGAIRKVGMLISLVFMLAIDVLIKINLIGFIPEQARTYLGLDTVGVAEFFALLYIAYEVVSIFKNMALCGLPVKKVWEKVREFLAKYTDELPDTDELDGDSTTGNVEEHRTQERYTAVMDALKKAGSVRAASDAVLTGYEKPADQSETVKKKRAEYGEGYYKKYVAGNGTKYYRVRKSWTDAASQLGAFTSLENAKSACKAGYTVYDDNGKAVYTAAGQQASAGVPFSVQVDILDLNIRTGAGTNYAKTGETTGKGVFTIVEVKAGQGASAGWGRLKSGAGWISLDYATRLA